MNRNALQTGVSHQMIVAGLMVTLILCYDVVIFLRPSVRVAVVCTTGAGESAAATVAILKEAAGIVCTTIEAIDLRDWDTCDRFDVLIFPGGSCSKQAEELGPMGRENVRRFVAAGGGYIGICAGAYLALCQNENALGIIRAIPRSIPRHHVEGWGRVSGEVRGGLLDISFTDEGTASLAMSQRTISMAYAGGPILSLDFQGADQWSSVPVVLATYSSEPSVFDFQQRMLLGTPAIITGTYGEGTVIAMSPHPDLITGAEQVLVNSVRFASRK